jgi:hypothetical protein
LQRRENEHETKTGESAVTDGVVDHHEADHNLQGEREICDSFLITDNCRAADEKSDIPEYVFHSSNIRRD